MNEGSSPTPSAALAAWLAAPSDRQRLAALSAASAAGAIPARTIDRLPAQGIAALHASEGVRFAELRPAVHAAILVAGLGPRLGITPNHDERRDLDALPFTVLIEGTELVLEVSPSVERRHGIALPFYHQWTAGVTASALVIDCSRLEQVNSVLIAWMLQIVQTAKPVPVHVRRTRPQVAAQLRQLRLDHLMTIS